VFSDGLRARCRRFAAAVFAALAGAREDATRGDYLRVAVLLTICTVLLVVGANATTYTPTNTSLRQGTVTQPANGTTVVSVQGYTFEGTVNDKKPARLLAADERARTEWSYESRQGVDA